MRLETAGAGQRFTRLRHFFLSPIPILFVSFFIPFTILVVDRTYQVDPTENHYGFGWEMGRVAASIASGHGFASPYPLPSGPTALLPPAYPYLLATIFKIFGVYSSLSAFVALTLNCLFCAGTSVMIFRIGEMVFSRSVAALAGWVWALNPFSLYLASNEFWDSSLTTLLLTLVVLIVFRLGPTKTLKAWCGFGVLCGLAALTNPTALSVLLFLWTWKAWQLGKTGAGWARPVGVTLLGFLVTLAPWQLRNYRTFRRMMPLRSGFGLELYVGNCFERTIETYNSQDFFTWGAVLSPNALGNYRFYPRYLYASYNRKELHDIQQQGEVSYMEEKRKAAIACIASHPKAYALLTLRRLVFTWTGALYIWPETLPAMTHFRRAVIAVYTLASIFAFFGLASLWQRRREQAVLFAALLILFPAVYYFTHTNFRYRYPIDPEILLLASASVVRVLSILRYGLDLPRTRQIVSATRAGGILKMIQDSIGVSHREIHMPSPRPPRQVLSNPGFAGSEVCRQGASTFVVLPAKTGHPT